MTDDADREAAPGAVTRVFAKRFATWGIALPADARPGTDGQLAEEGWTIRWRWHDAGALEVRAAHRMTSERWFVIAPGGAIDAQPVPAEFMVFHADDDRAAVEAEHRAAWRAHGERVRERGMDFHPAG